MSLGYDRDHAINERVSKARKHFTVRFECSVNAKSFAVIKKVVPGLSREFQKHHEKDKKVRGHESQPAHDGNVHTDQFQRLHREAA